MADVSLPGDDEDVAARKSSGRGTLIALAAIVVFGGGAGFFIRRSMQASERARTLTTASTAWRSLSRCLTGDAPLAAGEEVTWRVHRIELAREPVAPDAGEAATAGAWPYRCAPFATTLRDSLRAVSGADAAQRRLASLAERMRADLVLGRPGTLRPPEGQPAPLDELFAAATAAHLPAAGAPTGAPPPTPVQGVLTRAELRPLFATRADVETQVVSGDRTPGQGLRVLVSHGNLFGCRFRAGGDAASELATARCSSPG